MRTLSLGLTLRCLVFNVVVLAAALLSAARKAFASSHREVVLRMIKTTIEATKHATTNEEFTKKLIAKYLGVNDPDVLRQSYL